MTIQLKILEQRQHEYAEAIKALAGYKFWMFGYHAAAWVKYNNLLEGTSMHSGSPFKPLVDKAREMKQLDADEPVKSPFRIHPRRHNL